jgi:AbrB family looped-hinge helix DNA binding protein
MEVKVDSVGRIMVPKVLRDALGISPGSTVDISQYGAGLTVIPGGRTARIVEENGRLVVTGDTVLTDDVLFALIDAGRR